MPMQFVNRWVWGMIACLLLIGCADQTGKLGEQIDEAGMVETTIPPTAVPPTTPPPTETARPMETTVTRPPLDGENLTLAWRYDAGGAINHPPLFIEGVVVAVPVGGPLLALDAATGVLRWQYDPPQRIWERAYATDGRFIFLGIAGGQIVALDAASGAVVWQASIGIDTQIPPLVVANTLYVATTFVGPGLDSDPTGRAALFALDSATGDEFWSLTTDNYILQTPALHGDSLYVAGAFDSPEPVDEGGHMRLYALSAGDGALRWTYESEDGFPKQLYATETAVAYIAYQDFVSGVDAQTGDLRWRRDTGNWVPSLSGMGDALYFGSANTIVHALGMEDGRVLWQHNIQEGTFNYVLGAPVPVGDDLIFLTQHGQIMALNTLDGTLRWQFPTGITARTGLTVAGNWLFIGDEDGIIYAYTSPPAP